MQALFPVFNAARGYVEKNGKPGDEAKYFCTQDYSNPNWQYTVWAYSELMIFTQSALCFLVKVITIVSLNYLPFSSVELLYGGFWEHEHHTSTPSHPSPPLQGHTHYSVSWHHTFALTFVLEVTREQFSELSACVDAIKLVWPDPNSGRLSFMKHFFYEVREEGL